MRNFINWFVRERFFIFFIMVKGSYINLEVRFYILLYVLLKIIIFLWVIDFKNFYISIK